MENKKVIKISLSTFFLFLAIIVIVVMGIFMYKLYNEKFELAEKSAKQNEKISDLQNNVDSLTSKLNQISTLASKSNVSSENATNNISTNTITAEEKYSSNQNDLSTYMGLWEKSNNYLYIHSINNNEIIFDYTDQNGKDIGYHNKATLTGNKASFTINDENNSLNGEITLDNNNIIFNIIDSTFGNVIKGTIVFSDYLGLQN